MIKNMMLCITLMMKSVSVNDLFSKYMQNAINFSVVKPDITICRTAYILVSTPFMDLGFGYSFNPQMYIDMYKGWRRRASDVLTNTLLMATTEK